MTTLDEAIGKGRRKRRMLALIASMSLLALALLFFAWLFLTKGYSFTVKPDDAAPTQSFSVSSGFGFVIQNKFYLLGSSGSVKVSADKYQPKQVEVNDLSPSMLTVELEPLPAVVTVTSAPEVEDIAWQLDGAPYSVASTFTAELAPGQYQLTASHPSYESASLELEAEKAGTITEQLKLTPINGSLVIDSTPSGAKVSMNGEAVGETPVELEALGGEHEIRVQLDGYEVLEDTVTITVRNPDQERNYRLIPEQATVTVSMNPAGGVLLVNGSPAQSPVSVDANKQHQLRYAKAGFLSASSQVQLKPGENGSATFNLEPEMGTVVLAATKPSDVYVNGRKVGTTPVRTSLQTLPTPVEFRKEGYRTVKQIVQPQADKTAEINAEMLKEFDARRKEGRPLFISQLGIEMTRLAPKAFTMGSPPNETDRGRNEHQIKVDFSREVWISQHEITESQYAAYTGRGAKTSLPVTNVSWTDAVLYANWLSEQEGLEPFYTTSNGQVTGVVKESRGYRLPTEAEWEYIAKINRRARSTVYLWGDAELLRDNQGNFADESLRGQQTFILKDYNDGFAGKAPVGSFKADRGGFYDLDGNVREWVHDSYSLSPPATDRTYTDYLGAGSGASHVVKGASFKTGRMKNIRSSVREGETDAADDIGFRLARYHND